MIVQLIWIAAALVVCYAGVLALLWWHQERIVFQPPADSAPPPAAARHVRYAAADGVELFAYVVGDYSPDSTVILAFHGNADLARWLIPWATLVAHETRTCVMLAEYRGYDGLAGAPTYEASSLDARAALAYVRTALGVAPENIVYFGHSLGTAVAAELAATHPPRVLVLQSPFSSARAMARRFIVPGISTFWRVVSRVHFDTASLVRRLAVPVWVAHGDIDVIVPVRMGREVYDAAAHRGELLIVHRAGHNDVPDVGEREYWPWLARAVRARSPDVTPVPAAETRSAP